MDHGPQSHPTSRLAGLKGVGVVDLSPEARRRIRRILEEPKFELLPLGNVLEQCRYLPSGAQVSITASPTRTLEHTLDVAADLAMWGFEVVPHLSARMTKDLTHLAALLKRIEDLNISRVFVVGGDAPQQGDFPDGFSLISGLEKIGHDLEEIGIPCYPDGHSVIPDDRLWQALYDKQPHARYMTTQMCFDGELIADFLVHSRAKGVDLPVRFGIPGVADRLKLARISTRIGVGQSVRFLTKHRGLVSRFVRPGGFAPDELLEDLIPRLDGPESDVKGVHIYTFNQCDTTERWRQEYLAVL
ncbi:MAG: methylenetetrahydrofolate reductase [Acidimicrobiia bacterium]|nr:methylenetetrahydrofolate reductase [Acidimicrobiia bacterium]MYD04784.1 methylenetetrahydrofolate reductase [Acidimicrobiia bacterium]MYF26684.1 methylenetetrahydrofolate reductase [Acidimicrobiia bacterium]MYH55388.1 methylenetetrahydrofolate reductase [Acidimicrobiia bacterium]